ncbi:MAG: hypothetical protein AAF533_28965 [Acidobacteriota bacterium]
MPRGAGSTCDEIDCRVRACCLLSGECVELEPGECSGETGTSAPFGVFCEDTTCPDDIGACCAGDGSTWCTQRNEADCLAMGGEFRGVGLACGDLDCSSVRACCLPDASCAELQVQACRDAGGLSESVDSTCATVTCEPFQACCMPGHIFNTCFDAPVSFCLSGNWWPLGPGSECATTDCYQAACCLPDGSCTSASSSECRDAGGSRQPFGTVCETHDCTLVSCCLEGSRGVRCEQHTAAECVVLGGLPQEPGADCAALDCTAALERGCCLPDGTCAALTPNTCRSMGGRELRSGYDCEDADCSPVPCCFDSTCHDTTRHHCPLDGGVIDETATSCSEGGCRSPGAVPSGTEARPGDPLLVTKGDGDELVLSWSPSCSSSVFDHTIHEGTLGTWYSHDAVLCDASRMTTATIIPAPRSSYYLIVPVTSSEEGSAGLDSEGRERPSSVAPCHELRELGCP